MEHTRRFAIGSLVALRLAAQVEPHDPDATPPADGEARLPNGKRQSDAIAKKRHEDALRDAEQLLKLSEEIRDDLKQAGNYTFPVTTLKKIEEAEKLTRKIRGALKS